MIKTLIGKDNYLFLYNDSSKELEFHCQNVSTLKPYHYNNYIQNINKLLITIFPDKSIIYNQYLPDEYSNKCIYRENFKQLHNQLPNNIHNPFIYLKNIPDCYYTTDTHINFKGAYEVYKNSIHQFNELFSQNIQIKEINMDCIHLEKDKGLVSLCVGIGDLMWKTNCGDIILEDISDNYYYSNNIPEFYCKYKIQKDNIFDMKFYDYENNNKTEDLIDNIISWDIISQYIITTKNDNVTNKFKVLIFYDSFLLSTMILYMETFYECIFIKRPYTIDLINKNHSDYILEYKVERFLNP